MKRMFLLLLGDEFKEYFSFDYKAKVLCVVFLLEFLFFVYNR